MQYFDIQYNYSFCISWL